MDDFEDSLRQIKYEEHYAKGKMIATTQDTTQRALSSMPSYLKSHNLDKSVFFDKFILLVDIFQIQNQSQSQSQFQPVTVLDV